MNGSSKFVCVHGFAEELDEIVYQGLNNWFISFRSLFTIYSAHFSYLIVFFCIISCGLLSYRHSVENGHKFSQYWWGALIHGIISEQSFTKKYWHAQAPIMFFGKQLPLHIVFLYPSILYICMIAILKLKLNVCVEPAAVGLLAMLMEIPFRMISAKFLHITYHDTDPTFSYKINGVPWIEIFSSLLLASSYVAIYHVVMLRHCSSVSAIWDREPISNKNSMTIKLCAIVSPIIGFIQKLIFFHVLYDYFNVNLISCLFFTISGYLSFVICFEPRRVEKHVTEEIKGKQFLFYQLILYATCILSLAIFGNPQEEISIGTHEPTGDCTTMICSWSPLGKSVKRKKYLCADEVSARKDFVYSFNCLEEGPPCISAIWYTICGTPFTNRAEFILNVFSLILIIYSILNRILFFDCNKLEAAKRLFYRHKKEAPSKPKVSSSENAKEEITVGFVFVKNNNRFLPKGFHEFPKKVA